MKIEKNKSVLKYNTFGIDVKSKYFTSVTNEDQVRKVIQSEHFDQNNHLIIGGGSNLLFTKDFDGMVILNKIKGIKEIRSDKSHVWIQVGGGENWHEFVLHCIANNLGGIENLSLIPGSVGASPMQNIGAYGVEIKDVFFELEAINLATGEIDYFESKACNFGYRESVFKSTLKNKYLISRVTFKLTKANHQLNTSYGSINEELESAKISNPTIKDVSDAVIKIRTSKLPDPKKIGNAGSFFKNPVIESAHFEDLKKSFPEIVSYPAGDNLVKVAAGWLIDSLGWKGKTYDNYGVHKNQALVLVNYGGAKGNEIFDLSSEIIKSIQDKFNITLQREVNIY